VRQGPEAEEAAPTPAAALGVGGAAALDGVAAALPFGLGGMATINLQVRTAHAQRKIPEEASPNERRIEYLQMLFLTVRRCL
jgi:hypothetical protein